MKIGLNYTQNVNELMDFILQLLSLIRAENNELTLTEV